MILDISSVSMQKDKPEALVVIKIIQTQESKKARLCLAIGPMVIMITDFFFRTGFAGKTASKFRSFWFKTVSEDPV